MSTSDAERSWALRLLDQEASRNPRALDLSRFISPAVFVEPELLRAIRVYVMPKLDVGMEADIWFGKLVRSRGVDGIRLHHAVAKELRNQLKEAWDQGGASMRRRVRNAQEVMEKVHKNLSPALFIEERLSWLAIYGNQEAIENELGKVLVAISERDRPGLLRWWSNAWGRLPGAVLQSRTAWLLRQAVSARVGHARLKAAETPNGVHEIDLRTFLASVPDVKMGVRRNGTQLELGEIEGEGAVAVMLPDTDPRLVEVSLEEQNNLRRESVSVPLGEVVQLSVDLGAVELRTARDVVYRLQEIERGGQRKSTGIRRIFLSHTSEFTMYPEKRSFIDAAVAAVNRAGSVPRDMSYFTARDEKPAEYCKECVRECDVYIGVIGLRYGSPVRDRPDVSYTELEFEAATEAPAIKRFIFLLDPESSVPLGRFMDMKYGDRQERFRKRLSDAGVMCKLFSDVHELEKLIYQALKEDEEERAEPDTQQVRIDWPDGKSPYPGLEWFDEKYAPLFFGRDREVNELIGKLSEPGGRFLIISGASGSGKSSLVAAGLWQAVIKEGRLSGSQNWLWYRIQPSDGDTPFDALARKLKDVWNLAIRPDFTAKGTTLRDLHKHLRQSQELILVLDQLEELFTLGFNQPDIHSFLEQLISTAQDPTNRLRVVAMIRSESLGKLEAYESALGLLNSPYRYHLGTVSPRMLQDMIEKPVEATGYMFEPGLVEQILNDAGQEPSNLPLVAYALKQLFESRRDRTFTSEAYSSMGGVVGAIATKANGVLSRLPGEVQRAFDPVFAELVHLEREWPPRRRRAVLSSFSSDHAALQLIEALAGPDCRVLVTSGSGQEAIVEVANEKLFTTWPKLKLWIDDSGEALRDIQHAEEEAWRWKKGGDNPQELWLGSRAKKLLTALEQFGKHPSPELQRFLRPQEVLIAKLDHDQLSQQDRLLIGQKLAEFGDPRPGVGVKKDGVPDIAWVDIPGGQVKLENIDHVFKVKPFRIAKYSVTNAQFEVFLKAEGGYRDSKWWMDMEQSHEAIRPKWQEANCPRENASWYEAVAFCRWLSAKTGTSIRLPTECEWQQAATGGDPPREYPWESYSPVQGHPRYMHASKGGWDLSRGNSHIVSKLRRTTAVGMYPNGATLQGVLDMAGNVWEWCLSTHEKYERLEAADIDKKGGRRVARGGSWGHDTGLPTLTWHSAKADDRTSDIGFRLAQDIP